MGEDGTLAPAPSSSKRPTLRIGAGLDGTLGQPPTDPRNVVRFLLLKHSEGWPFDMTFDLLEARPELARKLGFRGRPRVASTVACLVLRNL